MNYIPDRGDIAWFDFDPRAGHEQAGRRPGLILTPKLYNKKSGLALVCPITSKVKHYPFEVPVSAGAVSGVILADHVASLDWSARGAKYVAKVSKEAFIEALAKISALLGIGE